MAFSLADLRFSRRYVNFTEWLSGENPRLSGGGWNTPHPPTGNGDPGVLVHQILLTFGFFTFKPKRLILVSSYHLYQDNEKYRLALIGTKVLF